MHNLLPENFGTHESLQLHAAASTNAPANGGKAAGNSQLLNGVAPAYNEETVAIKAGLVSMACHDLVSPLTCIRHCIELLASYELSPEKQEETIRVAMRSMNKIDAISNLWLDYDSALHGVHHPTLTSVCMKTAIEDAIGSVETVAAERNIQIVAENNVGRIIIPSVHLDQILVNLLSNAVQYADKRSTVIVRANLNDASVEIAIENKGPLISEWEKRYLFKKFSRIGPRPNRSRGSLGLFICQWLLTLDGGSINCADTPHRDGTVFTCAIPQRS